MTGAPVQARPRADPSPDTLDGFVRLYRGFLALIRIAANTALIALTIAVLAAVLVRYLGILPGSLHWTTEISRFGIVWTVMLGSVVAFDLGQHVAIDFTRKFPPAIRGIARGAAYAASIAFLATLAWQGFRLSTATMYQLSPALGLPMGFAYLAIPVGAAIMTFQAVLFALVPRLRPRDPDTGGDESGPADMTEA